MSERLRDVLAAHGVVATGLGEWCCECSPREWRATVHRDAHLEAVVLAWLSDRLADEAIVDAVRVEIRDEGLPYYVAAIDRDEYAGWGADAVLTTLRDALCGPVRTVSTGTHADEGAGARGPQIEETGKA